MLHVCLSKPQWLRGNVLAFNFSRPQFKSYLGLSFLFHIFKFHKYCIAYKTNNSDSWCFISLFIFAYSANIDDLCVCTHRAGYILLAFQGAGMVTDGVTVALRFSVMVYG